MKPSKPIVQICFWLFFVVLLSAFIPVGRELQGVVISEGPVETSFFEGTFQTIQEREFDELLGCKPLLVRLVNSVLFEFRKTHSHVVIGNGNILYEENYLTEYADVEPLSVETVDSVVNGLVRFREFLDTLDKKLLVVIAPSKTSFRPEGIPTQYPMGTTTNAERIKTALSHTNINMLDLVQTLKETRDTLPYAAFPTYGIHWTRGYSIMAFGELLKGINELFNTTRYSFSITQMEEAEYYSKSDLDLYQLLNLQQSKPKLKDRLARIPFEHKAIDEPLGLLMISDSFYWSWFSEGYTGTSFFNPSYFFYYNSEVHLYGEGNIGQANEHLFLQAIDNSDLICIMTTEANMRLLPYKVEYFLPLSD